MRIDKKPTPILSSGFTLLEVIFVIVILGIVASIGSTIVAQLYENYIVQRAMHRVSQKTELAANQIANRLGYVITPSVIVRDGTNPNNFIALEDIPDGTSNTTPQVLEWIGYDNDSFGSRQVPGWSGYCDVTGTLNTIAAGNRRRILTPGSRLGYANRVIRNLSNFGGGAPNGKTIANTAMLFSVAGMHSNAQAQNAGCFGYKGIYTPTGLAGNNTCIHTIRNTIDQTTLRLDNPIPAGARIRISPLYKFAWTAYAIVPVNIRPGRATTGNSALFDLELRYNFQPWDGTFYDDVNTQRAILIRNVTSFKYSQLGGTIRFKLCATEQVGGNQTDDINATNISVCKEKVVIR